MKRPYYVHTPRNVYGDSLVHHCNDVCYEIKATHTGDHVYSKIKDRTTADTEVKRLNDMHEAEIESTKRVEPVYPRSVTAFIQKWQPEADARRKEFWKEFRKAANAYADNKKNDERTRNVELERDRLKTALQEIVDGRHGAFVLAKNLLEKVENNVDHSVDDQQRLVGLAGHSEWREFDPKSELPRWLDEYKWHRDDATWSQCGCDWTADRLSDPHYPKVWRTRRPNSDVEASHLQTTQKICMELN